MSKGPEHPKKLIFFELKKKKTKKVFFNDYVDICRRWRPFYNNMSTEKMAANDSPIMGYTIVQGKGKALLSGYIRGGIKKFLTSLGSKGARNLILICGWY